MDKRNNTYLYITCFIVSIGGLLLGISANVSGASMYFGDFFGLTSGSFQEAGLFLYFSIPLPVPDRGENT